MSSQFFSDSIFWIEVEKIYPNPYQPRREFDEAKLRELADSIKMYGILQPLVVTRHEKMKEEGGLSVEYELISGERRLRASKLAGLDQVPVIIRASDQSDQEKLELAIIENLQREDLNSVDRARAFERLVKEFKFTHGEVGAKVGKSRVYVSNTLRILLLPEEILTALSEGKITEGHTRPLLMLFDRPEEQLTLYKEIVFKKITVREAEQIARKIAVDRVRKHDANVDPELLAIEAKLKESLGTRVRIERKEVGGKITIDFFSNDDLKTLVDIMNTRGCAEVFSSQSRATSAAAGVSSTGDALAGSSVSTEPEAPVDDRSREEIKAEENDEELYSLKNFSI
ncbi:MAG: ParB-like protein partition protein [Parcubacteria group bacterium GW2011_GWA2_47_16]|nr:MAG: ParB-like protein partition protein [Parcubacteria group bacterium GW2011_GWA2_47_16]